MSDDFFARAEALFRSSGLPESERANLRLRVVADHFSARTDHETSDLARILAALRDSLAHAAPAAVVKVAGRLASHPQADSELLTRLIGQGGETAAAVLRSGASFDRHSLLHLAEFGDARSAAAIAERGDVSRDLATILFRRPEREVLAALAGNRNVHLDRATAVWLVQRARHDAALARVLLARGPLACDLAPLFMFADAQARAAIIVEARRRDIGLVPEFRAPAPPEVADSIRRAISRRDRTALAGVFAEGLSLSRAVAARFVEDAGGEPLALMCNAAGVSSQQTQEILCWLQRRAPDDPDVAMLARLAADLAPQTARRIIASIVGRLPSGRTERAGGPIASRAAARVATEREIPSAAAAKS